MSSPSIAEDPTRIQGHRAGHTGAPARFGFDLPGGAPAGAGRAPPKDPAVAEPALARVAELLGQAVAMLGRLSRASLDDSQVEAGMELYEASSSVHRALIALGERETGPGAVTMEAAQRMLAPDRIRPETGGDRAHVGVGSGSETPGPEDGAGLAPSGLAPVSPPDFTISLTFRGDRTVLAVRGELDMMTAPGFGDFLEAATTRPGCLVILDFAQLTFIDASGLGQLARALTRLRNDGGDLAITSPSPMTYKVLALTGFTRALSVERPVAVEP